MGPRIVACCDSWDSSDVSPYRGRVRLPLAALGLSASLVTALVGAVPTGPATAAATAAPTAAATAAPTTAPTTAPAAKAGSRPVHHAQWDTPAELALGTVKGARVAGERVALAAGTTTRAHAGRTYDEGTWTSPWTTPGFALSELVPSWSARTPGDSWVEVKVRGRDATGKRSSWDVLGRWTSGDTHLRRTSVSGQGDDLASVNVDTWRAAGAGLTSWQVQVSLLRRAGTTARPSLDAVGAVASRLPAGPVATSAPGVARGTVLDVPAYSQMVHEGHYPQWGGGGEAWCSPTATSMVLAYYGALPQPAAYSWVPAGHPDPVVDHAARSTYDAAYRGTGNWPFNTAYAAPLAGNAFVTRLTSLRQAERFIARGIPLVASISFGRGQLDGAPISASDGHLLVIVGFTADGDVVVNDPAAPDSGSVRRTYDRAQLENAWLPTSGGLVYVIHDDAHPLPGGSSPGW